MANKKFIYYILAIAALSTIAVVYFISMPLIKDINKTKNAIETKKEDLFSLEQRERKLADLSTSYSEYKLKIDTLNNMFPNKKEISQYITQIENAGTVARINVKSLKIIAQTQQDKKVTGDYTQLAKKDNLYELPLEIILASDSYENILNYVKTLESLSRFTSITKVNVKSDQSGMLETTISFKVYVK